MPREKLLPKDSVLLGEEYVRIVDENGKSASVPISVFQSYIIVNQRFALYDAATPDPGSVAYSETLSNTSLTTQVIPVRLEFGPLTDEDYFPVDYQGVLTNQAAAPAKTEFDFRNLPLGTFVEFDVEFDLRLADDSGNRLDMNLLFYKECQYPNGDIERQTLQIPNDYIVATPEVRNNIKLTFSSYIKTALTDQLVGGGIEFGIIDDLSATEILTVNDLIVRAKL